MTAAYRHISVFDPISPAIERVRTILFSPFDLGRWFVIGFCAWLANFGWLGGSPNISFPSEKAESELYSNPMFERARDFTIDNLPWVILVGVIALIAAIILWLVLTWLSSRGRFMFLNCVAQNKAEVKAPWSKYRRHGKSLFLFRVVLQLIALVTIGLLNLPIFFLSSIRARSGASLDLAPLFGIIIMSLIVFVVTIIFAVIGKFTADFVIPIMSLRTTSCVAAWRQFRQILFERIGTFVLYILFQIVIAVAIFGIIVAAMCVTCCCAACIIIIPYISTVLILPLLIFKRAYSLYFLQQFGPEFDCLTSQMQDSQPTLPVAP